MMDYTFSRNASISKIRAGKYSNIRLFYGPMNFDYATNRTDIWVIHADQAGDPVGNVEFTLFSVATHMYTEK